MFYIEYHFDAVDWTAGKASSL